MTFCVTNLTCFRGETAILEGVSFDIAAGEALILRGPNGAGKTTLLRTIAGLARTQRDSVSFDPEQVVYGGHADGLKAQLSVEENLRFWAKIYGAVDISGAVEAFDLTEILDRPTGFLSAGQKRRTSLARLVLSGRALWALDEPTVSLDQENVARFAAAVMSHLGDGGSALIATHIDLGLTNARVLDVGQFKAAQTVSYDPFLDEALS